MQKPTRKYCSGRKFINNRCYEKFIFYVLFLPETMAEKKTQQKREEGRQS